MAHSNVWDATRPAGTVLAKNIDDEIRALRVDIQERMNESLTVSWGTEPGPVVPRPEILGNMVEKWMTVGFGALQRNPENSSGDLRTDRITLDLFQGPFVIPIPVPGGVVVSYVEMLMDRLSITSINWQLKYGTWVGPPDVLVASVNHTSNGRSLSAQDLTGSPVTNDFDKWWFILIPKAGAALGNFFSFYSARLRYATPDCRSTF